MSELTLAEIALPSDTDLLYQAWVVISNAGRGTWRNESPEWVEAAIRWRDQFHARLARERGL